MMTYMLPNFQIIFFFNLFWKKIEFTVTLGNPNLTDDQ